MYAIATAWPYPTKIDSPLVEQHRFLGCVYRLLTPTPRVSPILPPMHCLPTLSVLRALLARMIDRACGFDLSSPADMRALSTLSRAMARTAKNLAKAAEIEFRAKLKAQMLADHGWRWRVICDLGCYQRLDRWTREMALRKGRIPVKRADNWSDNTSPFDPHQKREQTSNKKTRKSSQEIWRCKTDESGWFRLAPIPLLKPRQTAPTAQGDFSLIMPRPRLSAATPAALKSPNPIPLTAQELDLRDRTRSKPVVQPYGLGLAPDDNRGARGERPPRARPPQRPP